MLDAKRTRLFIYLSIFLLFTYLPIYSPVYLLFSLLTHPSFVPTLRLQEDLDEALGYLFEATEVSMNSTLAVTLLPALRSAASFANASDGRCGCVGMDITFFYLFILSYMVETAQGYHKKYI